MQEPILKLDVLYDVNNRPKSVSLRDTVLCRRDFSLCAWEEICHHFNLLSDAGILHIRYDENATYAERNKENK